MKMKTLTKEFYINEERISDTKSKYPNFCIPISTDIRNFNFKFLAEEQKKLTGELFDVIMMDPPWQLSSSQPTRGVAIAYDTLNDNIISDIPVQSLQTDGFIFIWTINAKFKVTLDLLKGWGYR
jgi:mRNA (2'-O-methyladenosine-N6-)-methyltransferase